MAEVHPSHQLLIGPLAVEVTVKPIKHLHLSVLPPHGSVRISAPLQMSPEQVRSYAISKLAWIRRQQARFEQQERQSPRLVVERESHDLWGRRLLLEIQERKGASRVEVYPSRLVLVVRPGATAEQRQRLLARWSRTELRREAEGLIEKWQAQLDVQANRLFIQAMTRQWGSCNPVSRNIRLNTQLVHKPMGCLDYIVLHELSHLLVPSHGDAFTGLLDAHMPDWQQRRKLLNSLSLLTG